MHEASLVNYILNAVEKKAFEAGIRSVKRINIVAGAMRGIVPSLMDHSFKALTRRRPVFENAVLEIEYRDAVLMCRQCDKEYGVTEIYEIKCPECGSEMYSVIQGNELYIDSFEAE